MTRDRAWEFPSTGAGLLPGAGVVHGPAAREIARLALRSAVTAAVRGPPSSGATNDNAPSASPRRFRIGAATVD
ncbi:hypothetical protein [Streptomyces sp. DSM 41013]